jgi:hypothetical protein
MFMKKSESPLNASAPQSVPGTQEKRSEWKFSAAENGGWRWRVTHPDGTELFAHSPFATLKECIADARQHGYVVWIPEAERRKFDY